MGGVGTRGQQTRESRPVTCRRRLLGDGDNRETQGGVARGLLSDVRGACTVDHRRRVRVRGDDWKDQRQVLWGKGGPYGCATTLQDMLLCFGSHSSLACGMGRRFRLQRCVLRGPCWKGNSTGKRICVDLASDALRVGLHWCLLARDRAGYVRQQLTIGAASTDLPITEVRMLDFSDPGARVEGAVKGSPVVDGVMYFGIEHPLSWAKVNAGGVTAGITRQLPLRAGQSVTYSSVVGVAAPGQMRREFLAYLEAERPRRYEPFLHYNSWFDLGFGNRYDEAGTLDRIHAFADELVEKRHVHLDSFLFDDGWDNPNSLWGFDAGFPHGFSATADAVKKIHSGIGVWLSRWGGYNEQTKERIAYGRAHGYEIVRDGYALSGPKYYGAFEKTCIEMIDRFGVNQFKFDGTGNADEVFPGSAFDSDFDAASISSSAYERRRAESSSI